MSWWNPVSAVTDTLGITNSGAGSGASKAAIKTMGGVKAPNLQQIALQGYTPAADYRNYLSQLGPTQLSAITTDPTVAAAQKQALSQMGQYSTGQLGNQDYANLRQIQNQQNINSQGQRQALMQNAAARGQAGSGSSLASMLGANQGAANNAAQMGTQVAGQAANRGMEATGQMGQMAGQMRGQQYGEAANAANAQDYINQFNAQNQNQAGMGYAQLLNQLGQQNTDVHNQQTMYNQNQVPQQNFQNQMTQAQGLANAYQGAAQNQQQAAATTTGFFGSALGAASRAGGGK